MTDAPSGGQSVVMPALGESVTEGTVTRWLKNVGDSVAVDEPLLEVSTDKVDTEIPSPVAGTVLEILVADDETVDVRSDLVVIGAAVLSVAMVAITAATAARAPVWGFVLAVAAAGLAMGTGSTTLSVLVLDLTDSLSHGRASAALQLSDVLGSVVGIGASTAVFGALLARGSTTATGPAPGPPPSAAPWCGRRRRCRAWSPARRGRPAPRRAPRGGAAAARVGSSSAAHPPGA